MNVLSANQQLGMIPRDESGIEIKYDSKKINTYKIVKDGDYVIHLRSFQGGFAFSSLDGICSPAYTILRPNSKFLCYSFLKEYFVSSRFIKSLKLVTFGLRDGKSIDVDLWLQTEFRIPSLNEQEKIIVFINTIQKKINIIKDKLNVLKKYKEGLCNYFFKIEENDHHQLKEYVNNYASQLLTKDIDHNIGEYPVYDASGSPYKNIDFYQQDKDTISIIKYGSGCGRTFISRGYHSILGTMTDLIPNQNVDVYFIYAFTLSKYFKSIVKKYIEIGTTPNLYYSDYSKAIISNKALCSCKSISIIINSIESKEKLLSNELKDLNVIKKNLLNKMFI